MADRLTDLEGRVAEIEERLTALEAARPSNVIRERIAEPEPPPSVAAIEPSIVDEEEAGWMALAGRCVLILGGAYLLRALTDSKLLPPLGAVAAGLMYAAFWMWRGEVAGAKQKRLLALFECTTAAVIAYPLIWETTTRFQVITPVTSGILIVIVSLALLWTAVRAGLPQVAWMVSIASAITSGAVATGAHSNLPLMVTATLFAVIMWHVASSRGWPEASWPAIAASDLLALALIATPLIGRNPHTPGQVILGLEVFAVLWIAALSVRALLDDHELNIVETAQLIEAVLIATTGSAIAARILGTSLRGVAWFSMAVTLAMVMLFVLARRRGLHLLGTTASFGAAAAALLAFALLFGASNAAIVWALIAVGAAEWARRSQSPIAVIHSVVWIGAAAIGGGTVLAGLAALADRTPGSVHLPAAAIVISMLALIAFFRIDIVCGARGAAITHLSIGMLGAIAGVIHLSVVVFSLSEPMRIALARTIVLALAAAILGLLSRLMRSRAAAVVARAIVAMGGVKLLLEDLRVSNAAVLVVAFAAYGAAMLLVARASRSSHLAKHPAGAPAG